MKLPVLSKTWTSPLAMPKRIFFPSGDHWNKPSQADSNYSTAIEDKMQLPAKQTTMCCCSKSSLMSTGRFQSSSTKMEKKQNTPAQQNKPVCALICSYACISWNQALKHSTSFPWSIMPLHQAQIWLLFSLISNTQRLYTFRFKNKQKTTTHVQADTLKTNIFFISAFKFAVTKYRHQSTTA